MLKRILCKLSSPSTAGGVGTEGDTAALAHPHVFLHNVRCSTLAMITADTSPYAEVDSDFSSDGCESPVKTASLPATVKRTMGVWGFAFVCYFIVSGGPFGIEVAVRSAGALPVMIGFLLMPFVFALPQVRSHACICAHSHSLT